MRRFTLTALVLGVSATVALSSQTGPAAARAVIYENARLIVGDAATPPIAARRLRRRRTA